MNNDTVPHDHAACGVSFGIAMWFTLRKRGYMHAMVEVCRGKCGGYVGCQCGDWSSEVVELVDYCTEVRAKGRRIQSDRLRCAIKNTYRTTLQVTAGAALRLEAGPQGQLRRREDRK